MWESIQNPLKQSRPIYLFECKHETLNLHRKSPDSLTHKKFGQGVSSK